MEKKTYFYLDNWMKNSLKCLPMAYDRDRNVCYFENDSNLCKQTVNFVCQILFLDVILLANRLLQPPMFPLLMFCIYFSLPANTFIKFQ